MPDHAPSTTPEERFIQSLTRLLGAGNNNALAKPDRAALATLRRGLGKTPGEVAEMFPYVIPYCSHLSEYRQNDYFLVAALFALHQETSGPNPGSPDPRRNNLGASFKALANKTESASIERRFVALLNASREELDDHLRYAISLLKAHQVGVDWTQLLRDLNGWDSPSRYVQRRWAQGYWQDLRPQPQPNNSGAQPGTTAPSLAPNANQ